MVKSGISNGFPYVSTSLAGAGRSSEARDERDVDDAECLGLSAGEISAEDVGVDSVVASRRRAVSDSKAVVVMVG